MGSQPTKVTKGTNDCLEFRSKLSEKCLFLSSTALIYYDFIRAGYINKISFVAEESADKN